MAAIQGNEKEFTGGTVSEAPMGMGLREKTWNERGIEEKVEVLRRVILDLSYQFRADEKRVQSLMKHDHIDGKIVVPFNPDPHVELPFWANGIK